MARFNLAVQCWTEGRLQELTYESVAQGYISILIPMKYGSPGAGSRIYGAWVYQLPLCQ